jgi:NAD(P)-dependent dehydrogenase (short-subunit alcohol dehydrogenase family)
MDLHLKDKVVIVTGGTKGIGEGIVRSMAVEGATVFMVNRAGSEGLEIERELSARGYKVMYLEAELTDVPECRKVVDVVLARFGRIDVIVNNAGFNDQLDLRSDPEVFMKGLRDNLIHYYALVHYAHDTLIAHRGNVVNIGSHVSITGQGRTSAYVAAKGAIDGLTREWAAYFCDKGVRVNCLVPGSVWTNSYVRWAAQFPDPEERRAMAEQNIPLGRRMTTVEEFADMVVFVASARASHLTGQIIVNDGGYCHLDRVLT